MAGQLPTNPRSQHPNESSDDILTTQHVQGYVVDDDSEGPEADTHTFPPTGPQLNVSQGDTQQSGL